jgi:bifunctional NMN adenylyltransferase/nudix hydrolase
MESYLRMAMRASAVFDHPDRSVRGRTITHAFHFDLDSRRLPEIKAGDDAAGAKWIPIGELKEMGRMTNEDHLEIIDHFLGIL